MTALCQVTNAKSAPTVQQLYLTSRVVIHHPRRQHDPPLSTIYEESNNDLNDGSFNDTYGHGQDAESSVSQAELSVVPLRDNVSTRCHKNAHSTGPLTSLLARAA